MRQGGASAHYGADRTGGTLARIARAPSDTGTLWAATSAGRLFITKNAAAEPSTAVTFTRLDSLVANDPNRFITGIYVDASNPNRAFVSYSGYNTTVGSTAPGHVFEVTFNPAGPPATWVDWSYDLADLPLTDVAFDDPTGDLYVSTDFGVMRGLAAGRDAGPRQVLRGVAEDDVALFPRHVEHLRRLPVHVERGMRAEVADARLELDAAVGLDDEQAIEPDRPT